MPRQDVLPVAAAQETDRTITDYDAAVKGYVVPDGMPWHILCIILFYGDLTTNCGTVLFHFDRGGTFFACGDHTFFGDRCHRRVAAGIGGCIAGRNFGSQCFSLSFFYC